MKKLVFLSLILLTLIPFSAKANGGPVAELSALTLSRAPMMRHCPEVQLLREEVSFIPLYRYTMVEVKYLLHNTTAKELKDIWYGFPIDWYGSQDSTGWWTKQPFTDGYGQEVGWRNRYIRTISFFLNDKFLPCQESADSVLRKGHPLPESMYDNGEPNELWDSVEDAGGFYTVECDLNRRWYYTTLTLGPDEVAELKVGYIVHNHVDVYGEMVCVFDRTIDWSHFEYDFSPASYWGNGRVLELTIEVDTATMKNNGNYLSFNKNYPLKNISDSRWTLQLRDVDLAAAEPFSMGYEWSQEPRSINELLSLRVSPLHYSIIPSGVDPKYPIGNLSDLDPKTATVLRPDKEGKYHFTLHMHDSITVTSVIVIRGYGKDSVSWYNNSRIADLNPLDEVSAWSWNNSRQIKEPKSFDWKGLIESSFTIILGYEDIYYNEDTHWNPSREGYFTDVRFDVTDVTKGNKYDDLCISEIIVLGTPKKKMQ